MIVEFNLPAGFHCASIQDSYLPFRSCRLKIRVHWDCVLCCAEHNSKIKKRSRKEECPLILRPYSASVPLQKLENPFCSGFKSSFLKSVDCLEEGFKDSVRFYSFCCFYNCAISSCERPTACIIVCTGTPSLFKLRASSCFV